MKPGSMRYRCNCGGKIYVKETRATDDAIWRTRKCRDCGMMFTTTEIAVEGFIPREARLAYKQGAPVDVATDAADEGDSP